MHSKRILIAAALVIALTSLPLAVWSYRGQTYSSSELDEILAPIALYPDPLIAQILPAATYPDQLLEADDLFRLRGSQSDIDRQNWDVSVKAIAYYPSVLQMMVDKPDWTDSVGQAYIYQPDDVMRAIQRLRGRARSYGYLSSNSYQRVYLNNGDICIVPADGEYLYVPQYDPREVYVQRRGSSGSNLISFGLGLLIGSWLNRDVDWGHHRVYYHDWRGGGWIGNSRSHVSTDNNYYVNPDFRKRPITVDHSVTSHDITSYRNSVRSSAGKFQPSNYPKYTRARDKMGVTPAGPTKQPSSSGKSNRTNDGSRGNSNSRNSGHTRNH